MDCINFKLSSFYSFFDEASFNESDTLVIEPRSEKVVYNSFRPYKDEVISLSDYAVDLFPDSSEKQQKFLEGLKSYLDQNYRRNP